MQKGNEKFLLVRNGRTGEERKVPAKGAQQLLLNEHEYVVPFSIRDKWMLSRLANLIKFKEIEEIKARLDNLNDWANQQASFIPGFYLAEQGSGKYPNAMTYEEVARFRQKFSGSIGFYSIAIQYLERGHSLEEVEALMRERHSGAIGNLLDCIGVATTNHDGRVSELKAKIAELQKELKQIERN